MKIDFWEFYAHPLGKKHNIMFCHWECLLLWVVTVKKEKRPDSIMSD